MKFLPIFVFFFASELVHAEPKLVFSARNTANNCGVNLYERTDNPRALHFQTLQVFTNGRLRSSGSIGDGTDPWARKPWYYVRNVNGYYVHPVHYGQNEIVFSSWKGDGGFPFSTEIYLVVSMIDGKLEAYEERRSVFRAKKSEIFCSNMTMD